MTANYETLAQHLRTAYRSGAIPPLRDGLEPTDAEGAYAIQLINTRHWSAAGRRITGRKVGLTSKAVQAQLGVDQPDFGVLFADMAVGNGGTLSASLCLQPKVEAEVAFVMGRPVNDPSVTAEAFAAAIDHVVPALEIVDSRIADWKITFADTVADNGSAAFYVLGTEARLLKDVDLWSCGMVLEIDGFVQSLGAGAACLGHPLNAATWLARALGERGEGLQAGDVILSGALGPMVALRSGNLIRTTIGGLGTCEFSYDRDKT